MSELLLDTHVFIWFTENSPKLPIAIREEIGSGECRSFDRHLSSAEALGIAPEVLIWR